MIDLNSEHVFKALKLPQAKKIEGQPEAASQRLTCLRQLLGERVPEMPAIKQALLDGFAEGLGIKPVWG